MLLNGFFCLLVIGFTSARLDMKGCGISKTRHPRIIGGKPANSTSYPWMVFLEIKKRTVVNCGGTILNEKWIVTAAHCVEGVEIKDTIAYVGLRLRSKKENAQKYKLSKIIMHSQYKNGYLYDIALLKTEDPIDIKGSAGRVNGICLPESDSHYPTGNATVIGWGLNSWNNSPDEGAPDALQEVVVDIAPPDACRNSTSDKIPALYVCAGGNGKNACKGDSGGPLFQIKKGVAYLIGITSTARLSRQHANGNMPSVFTKVSAFLDWMEKKMT